MKNKQRIIEACLLHNVYTPEEMQELLEQGKEPEVHTKTYWQEKGKKPKEGIEGIKTKLWKKKGEEDKYFLVNATLFSESMVEDII